MSFESLALSTHPNLGNGDELAVDLRRLHQALGAKQHFRDWSKKRLAETQAEQGIDYLAHKIMRQVPHQGALREQAVKEFVVTIDLAKEIAMLERNSNGKRIRRYFIEAEKNYRKNTAPPAVAWVLGQIARTMPWSKVLELILPLHTYGSLAANGVPRTGFRRPAFVAAPHRTAAATDFHEHAVLVKLLARQQELPLTEGGAHG